MTNIENIPHIMQNGITHAESYFALELLTTIDFLIAEKGVTTSEGIISELENWSERKKTMFNNPRFIRIAIDHIQHFLSDPNGR